MVNPEKREPEQVPYSLSEHLAEGIPPIMACVGTREQFGQDLSAIENIEETGHNANFSARAEVLNEKGFKNAGEGTYMISSIDSKPKFTKGLLNCTSMVAVGREKGTGEEISFITHQNPGQFLRKRKDEFSSHIAESLSELKKRCEDNSIDVVIAGGNANEEIPVLLDDYKKSVKKLGGAVQETLGFDPIVIAGPKSSERDAVYFDTKNRRLFVIRPEDQEHPAEFQAGTQNEPFKASEIDKKFK